MSHNTLVHRAVRPVVRQLGRTGLQPNTVTAIRILLAVAAAACFAMARPNLLYVGCVLFAGAALLDRVDGELARLTRRFSAWGHRMDLVADCSADALAFLGLGYGGRSGPLGLWSPLLGVSAGASIVALFWQFNIRQCGATPRAPGRRFDPDDAMFLVPVLLVCAGIPPVMLLAGVVTPLAATYAIYHRITL